jgi:hypothetical protein
MADIQLPPVSQRFSTSTCEVPTRRSFLPSKRLGVHVGKTVHAASGLGGCQVDPYLQRRWPSLIRSALAFWRSEPTERLISLEIFFTRILSFE